MKAIVWTKPGPPDVLQLKEIAKPAPSDKEVLIKIYATTVTTADCELRSLKIPFPLRLPIQIMVGLGQTGKFSLKPQNLILGQELAGEIEAVGSEVKRFKKGDQVFGWTGFALGAHAEYKCLPESGTLAIKPPGIPFEDVAPLPLGGLEAVHFSRKANIQQGQKVLIFGAGGSIGAFAVQLAKYYGAEVTAVDSAGKLDMLRSIGADHVIDYMQEDFTRNGEIYDVIFDVVGKSSYSRSLRSLTPNGRYILGNPRFFQRFRWRWTSSRSSKKVMPWAASTVRENIVDLTFLTELIEAGKLRSVIDRRYPLEQIAEAHRYVDTGQKKGNVVITVDHSG